MEAAGVATAASQSSENPGFFMVRSVSDLADENKGAPEVNLWRSYACDVAASFTIEFLKDGPIPFAHNKRVQLNLEGDFDDFTDFNENQVVGVLAAVLDIDKKDIHVVNRSLGSIIIVLEMPEFAAENLYLIALKGDLKIPDFEIKSLFMEDKKIITFSRKLVNRSDETFSLVGQTNSIERSNVMASVIDIEGVGVVFAKKLKEAGVATTDALLIAGATPKGRKDLAAKAGIDETKILEWVNRADLYRIKGVGSEYSDLLEASGVDTIVELSKRVPANLFAKMVEVNKAKKLVRKMPIEPQVKDWIEQAKALPRKVSY